MQGINEPCESYNWDKTTYCRLHLRFPLEDLDTKDEKLWDSHRSTLEHRANDMKSNGHRC